MSTIMTVPEAREGHAAGMLPEPALSRPKKRRGHTRARPSFQAAVAVPATVAVRWADRWGSDRDWQLLRLCPGHPSRPIDWRWQLAGYLAGGVPCVPEDWSDGWVRRARSFREDLHQCRSSNDRAALARRHPDIAGAFALASESGWGQGQEGEARLLAGQPVPVVAATVGLTPAIVDAYEALFFSFRDRAQNTQCHRSPCHWSCPARRPGPARSGYAGPPRRVLPGPGRSRRSARHVHARAGPGTAARERRCGGR